MKLKFISQVSLFLLLITLILINPQSPISVQAHFDYVNQFRVEEVKKRMSDINYKHLTLLGIALDCGFNSKSSFNNIFKKITNYTPTEYKNLQKPSE